MYISSAARIQIYGAKILKCHVYAVKALFHDDDDLDGNGRFHKLIPSYVLNQVWTKFTLSSTFRHMFNDSTYFKLYIFIFKR